MKKIIFYTIFLLPINWAFAEALSLRQAIEMALKNNPCIQEATERINQAQAQTEQFRAAFSPMVNVGSSYTRTDLPMNAFGNIINQRSYRQGIDFNRPGTVDNLGVQGGISYNIYNGGKDKASMEMARKQHQSKQKNKETIESELIFAVIVAFYNIKQAEECLKNSEGELAAFKSNLDVAEIKYKGGTLLKDEVLKWEVQIAKSTEDQIKNKHMLVIARKTLSNLLGLRNSMVTAGDDDIEFKLPTDEKRQRAELAAFDLQISALEAKISSIRAERLPSINTFANTYYNKGGKTGGNGTCWGLGVSVNLNVWDGQLVSSKIREAQAELRAANAKKKQLELAIELENEQTRSEVSEKFERYQVVRKMVELAEETAQLSRKRYSEGLLLTSDLISVEQALSDSKMRFTLAKNNKILSIARYRKSLGQKFFD
ncbi:MAG: hypothetical protein A2007_00645 [Verrucomicrobia bacterium GWC2_42_7]|nr:MAG: hypothetical protein A2007_00645 [Verrucomicrobia bacterium GWC2_42_7]